MKRAYLTKISGVDGVWGDLAPCRPAPDAFLRPLSRELTPDHAQKDVRALKTVAGVCGMHRVWGYPLAGGTCSMCAAIPPSGFLVTPGLTATDCSRLQSDPLRCLPELVPLCANLPPEKKGLKLFRATSGGWHAVH